MGYPFNWAPFRLEASVTLFDGVLISGFGKGDVIVFTPYGKNFDSTIGADGKVIVYSTNETRVKANLIVTSHSGALKSLWDLQQAQLAGPGILAPAFWFFDPSTGTTISDFGVFIDTPKQNFSNGDQFNREFEILLPTAMQLGHMTLGPLNLVP